MNSAGAGIMGGGGAAARAGWLAGGRPWAAWLRADRERQFWAWQAAGWAGVFVVSFLSLTLWYNFSQPKLAFLSHNLAQSALGAVLALPLRWVFRAVWNRSVLLRLAVGAAAVLAVSLAWCALRLALFIWMIEVPGLWADFGGWYFSSIFIFLCWSALYHAIKYFHLLQDEHELLLRLESSVPSAAARAAGRRLAINTGSRVRFIPFKDIDWVDAAGDYMCIHAGGETHIARITMKELLQKLDAPFFKRIHRSTLVNVNRIAEIITLAKGGRRLVLNSGEQLTVSRNYRHAVEPLRQRAK